MDKGYADIVRLLLAITPDVFANDIFAMKGGSAINLFVRDMPRLSVDIDVVYTPWQHTRDQALPAIAGELDAIARRVAKLGLNARKVTTKELGDTKLLVENDSSQVNVEVNAVFRGTVLNRATSAGKQNRRDVRCRTRGSHAGDGRAVRQQAGRGDGPSASARPVRHRCRCSTPKG